MSEHQTEGIVTEVHATDLDIGVNAKLQFSILSDETAQKGHFKVDTVDSHGAISVYKVRGRTDTHTCTHTCMHTHIHTITHTLQGGHSGQSRGYICVQGEGTDGHTYMHSHMHAHTHTHTHTITHTLQGRHGRQSSHHICFM